jgi:serine/threonine protein kinase
LIGCLAPEVLLRENHGISVDYYALGVLLHEIIFGKRPYVGSNRAEIREAVTSRAIELQPHQMADWWSPSICDFLNRLLKRKPEERLGRNGPEEVKQHEWLRMIDWVKLAKKEVVSPFNEFLFSCRIDVDYVNSPDAWDIKNQELIRHNEILLRSEATHDLFKGYEFDDQSLSEAVKEERERFLKKFEAMQTKEDSPAVKSERPGIDCTRGEYIQEAVTLDTTLAGKVAPRLSKRELLHKPQ